MRPERATRSRQEDGQVSGHGQFEIHERLDVRMIEVKNAFA